MNKTFSVLCVMCLSLLAPAFADDMAKDGMKKEDSMSSDHMSKSTMKKEKKMKKDAMKKGDSMMKKDDAK